jgi:hypothetical protein
MAAVAIIFTDYHDNRHSCFRISQTDCTQRTGRATFMASGSGILYFFAIFETQKQTKGTKDTKAVYSSVSLCFPRDWQF